MDILLDFDHDLLTGDIRQAGADLEADAGLKTAVFISLFTDARALDDDELPPGQTDRRGWWGDMLAGQQMPGTTGPTENSNTADKTGSRRWLYMREKQTAETARKIRKADEEALAWLIDDGIAASVTVETRWIGPPGFNRGLLGERIIITKASGDAVKFQFNHLWEGV